MYSAVLIQFEVITRYFDSLVQDCSNSIADALELLQSCTKPSIWCYCYDVVFLLSQNKHRSAPDNFLPTGLPSAMGC